MPPQPRLENLKATWRGAAGRGQGRGCLQEVRLAQGLLGPEVGRTLRACSHGGGVDPQAVS